MADLTLPEVITRFRGNEARITDFTNGNAAGYYITVDGKKVETLPSLVTRLATAIAAASATRNDLSATGGAKLIGFGATTVDAALVAQAKGIADNAKAITDLDTAKLAKGGGTMTGALKLAGAPTDSLHAATKGWAEALVGTYWKPVIGDVLTTVRGAPDATWIPDGANYLQASYPDLFQKLGLLDADATGNGAWPKTGGNVQGILSVALGKDGVICAAVSTSSQGIMRSADGGASFTKILSITDGQAQGIDTDKAGVWITVGSNGFLRSADNGLTWTPITSAAGIVGQCTSIVCDRKGTWIACSPSNQSFILKSKDNGLTWTRIALTYAPFKLSTNRNGLWIMSTQSSGIGLRSTDNGETWTQISLLAAYNGQTIVTYGNGVFVAVCWNSSNQYSYYAVSIDGLTWSSVGQYSASQPPYGWDIDDRGLCWFMCYTGSNLRLTVGISAAGAAAIFSGTVFGASTGPGAQTTWPNFVVTDGQYGWIAFGGSSGDVVRCNPSYDVKTLFKVPKAATQPAPFANFIKAK